MTYVKQELEDFMAKGITGSGQGFDAPSMGRLGGKGHNPSSTELRNKLVQVNTFCHLTSSAGSPFRGHSYTLKVNLIES